MGDSYRQSMKIFIGGLSFETTDDALKRYFEQFGVVTDAIVMKDSVSRRSRGFGFITYTNAASVEAALSVEQHIVDNRRVEAKRAVPRSEVPKVSLLPTIPRITRGMCCLPHTIHSHLSFGPVLQADSLLTGSPLLQPSQPTWDPGFVVEGHLLRGLTEQRTRSNSTVSGGSMGGAASIDGALAINKIFVGGLHYETRDASLRAYFEQFGRVAMAEVMFNRETHKSRGFGFVVFENEESANAVLQSTHHTVNGKVVEVKRAVPRSQASTGGGSSGPSSPVLMSFGPPGTSGTLLQGPGGPMSQKPVSKRAQRARTTTGRDTIVLGPGACGAHIPPGTLQQQRFATNSYAAALRYGGGRPSAPGMSPQLGGKPPQHFGHLQGRDDLGLQSHPSARSGSNGMHSYNQPFGPGGPTRAEAVAAHAFVQRLKAWGAKNSGGTGLGETFDPEALLSASEEHLQHLDHGIGERSYGQALHGLAQGSGHGQGAGNSAWSSVAQGSGNRSRSGSEVGQLLRSGGGERVPPPPGVRYSAYDHVHDVQDVVGHHGGGGSDLSPLFHSRLPQEVQELSQWQPLNRMGVGDGGSSLSTPVGSSPRLLNNDLLENAIAELSLDGHRSMGSGSTVGSTIPDNASGNGSVSREGQSQLPLLFSGLGGGGPPSSSSEALAYGRAGGDRAVDGGGLSGDVSGSSLWRADAFGSALSVNVTSTAGDAGGPAPGHGTCGGSGAAGEGKDVPAENEFGSNLFVSDNSSGLAGLQDMFHSSSDRQGSSSGVGRAPGLSLDFTGHRVNHLSGHF
ncbi:unnamed protein product [Choristocarpus tenellus]